MFSVVPAPPLPPSAPLTPHHTRSTAGGGTAVSLVDGLDGDLELLEQRQPAPAPLSACATA
eukprot:605362-Rhodomonas_salina.1